MHARLTLAAVASLALATACQREPSFDEKFEQQSRALSAEARKIEAETRAQLAAAREADRRCGTGARAPIEQPAQKGGQ